MSQEIRIPLYGDNGECFAEIDQATLTREWNYLQQFSGIFSPYGGGSDKRSDPKDFPRPTLLQPKSF